MQGLSVVRLENITDSKGEDNISSYKPPIFSIFLYKTIQYLWALSLPQAFVFFHNETEK